MSKNKYISNRRLIAAALTASCLLAANPALAAPPLSEAPDAGKSLRETQQTEKRMPARQVPKLDVVGEAKPQQPAISGPKVFVKNFRITGQDILAEDELLKILAGYVNREQDFAGLQAAANQVAKYFHGQGYLVAQAYLPAQELDKGTVEIAVIVGRYGNIILKNQSSVKDSAIRNQLASITPGAYIRSCELERAVLLTSDLAGVSTHITLVPGKASGTSDIIVDVTNKEHQLLGNISFNNWGNRFTGANQANLAYSVSNPAGSGDSAGLNVTSAGSGLAAGSISYRLPLADGSSINFSYSKMRYELGEDFADLNAVGTAYTQHVDWNYTLRRSRNSNQYLQFGYDHKRLEDRIDSTGAVTDKQSHAVSLGISGDGTDRLGRGGSNSYAFTWYRGSLSGQSNTGAVPSGNWKKFTYNFMRQQYLTDRLSLWLAVSGQKAGTNLDSSERFTLGGANAVRAYPAGEASGDEAWLFTGELRWLMSRPAAKHQLQLAAFCDTGTSHIEKNAAGSEQNRRSLSGAGLGIQYYSPGDCLVKASYAWKTGSETAKSDTDKNGRLWLQMAKYF